MTEEQWIYLKRFMLLMLRFMLEPTRSKDMAQGWWDASNALQKDLENQ